MENEKFDYNDNLKSEDNENLEEIKNTNIDEELLDKNKDIKNNNNENKTIDIEKLEKKYLDKILRLNAELENVYKRNSIEIEKVYKFSLEKFFIDLIPTIDNLERTKFELNKKDYNINIIIEGIKLTIKLLLKTIKKFNISTIEDINIPFNSNFHEAVITIENNSLEDNTVLEIMQKGYLLHDRLIRPAMVKVSKKTKK